MVLDEIVVVGRKCFWMKVLDDSVLDEFFSKLDESEPD